MSQSTGNRKKTQWVVCATCGLLFLLLAAWQAVGITPLDRWMAALAAGTQPTAVTLLFRGITLLGEPVFHFLLCLACVVTSRGSRWSWFFAGNALLVGLWNQGLKAIFRRSRPAVEWMLTNAGGYSFPSGHAMGAMAIYGFAVYLIWHSTWPARIKKAAIAVLTSLILLIGISRIALRVHHTTDVLAGWAAGFVYLMGTVALYRKWGKPKRK